MVTHGPRIIPGVVAGRPFNAKTESRAASCGKNARPETVHGSVARDSSGRLRQEFIMGGTTIAISLADPVAGRLHAIDPRTHQVASLAIPGSVATPLPRPAEHTEERVIEGVACYRLSVPELVDEAWISIELAYPVLERSLDGEYLWRLYGIKMGEQDPRLFVTE
jgi:hypothetical protein